MGISLVLLSAGIMLVRGQAISRPQNGASAKRRAGRARNLLPHGFNRALPAPKRGRASAGGRVRTVPQSPAAKLSMPRRAG